MVAGLKEWGVREQGEVGEKECEKRNNEDQIFLKNATMEPNCLYTNKT